MRHAALLSWAAYIAEHATNPGFATFGDALWWGIVTLTTVGYGDIVPKTTTGRVAGVFLMITGVATLGIISGTLASFFKSARDEDADSGRSAAAPASAADVVVELSAVRAQLAALEAQAGSGARRERRHELTEPSDARTRTRAPRVGCIPITKPGGPGACRCAVNGCIPTDARSASRRIS